MLSRAAALVWRARWRMPELAVNFVEINLFGVYVSPISLLALAAWLVTIALRRIAVRMRWLALVWHPSIVVFSVYIIVLSSMVVIIARWIRHV